MERASESDRYRIIASIGKGGMGEVYRARDTRLDRDVAIKILPAAVASDPDRLRRLEQEARVAGQINHPNVVAIYARATTAFGINARGDIVGRYIDMNGRTHAFLATRTPQHNQESARRAE